jgi:hypothetical protein
MENTMKTAPRRRQHVHPRLRAYWPASQATFVGQEQADETSGEGLDNFGARWYVVPAGGQKVERHQSTSTGSGSASGFGRGYSSGPRQVPAGIGIAPPYEVERTPSGAFVAGTRTLRFSSTSEGRSSHPITSPSQRALS